MIIWDELRELNRSHSNHASLRMSYCGVCIFILCLYQTDDILKRTPFHVRLHPGGTYARVYVLLKYVYICSK